LDLLAHLAFTPLHTFALEQSVSLLEVSIRGVALPQMYSGKGSSQESKLNLTPKEFANFSPGFRTLGNKAVKILFTLKELGNRMELFQS
jgi:hypothetical protein